MILIEAWLFFQLLEKHLLHDYTGGVQAGPRL